MTDFRRWFPAVSALVLSTALADAQPYLISTYAGGLAAPTSASATAFPIQNPNGVAADPFGSMYLSTASNCVFRLDPSGNLSRVAGTCQAGYSGDGGSAVAAELNNPQGLAVDALGNLYIADQGNQRIRKVTPAGTINTVAGTGTFGYSGDNGPATSAALENPHAVAVDNAGNLYIADMTNNAIRKVAPNGTITTIAGTGTHGISGDGGPATGATLSDPVAVAVDTFGDLYIGDESNQIRKVNSGGTITHVAGTGMRGFSEDPGPAFGAQLTVPAGLAVDPAGNLYVADQFNLRVRKITPSGIISTYAGGGGVLGDGGPALDALVHYPVGVAADYSGNLYIAEMSNRVRIVNSSQNITTAVGTGTFPFSGDGGAAPLAQFGGIWGIAADVAGNLYVADQANNRVRKIVPPAASTQTTIATFAGNGADADTGNGGQATSASVTPYAVAVDGANPPNVYIADYAVVRKVAPNGTISTVAGTGTPGAPAGDGGPATAATLSFFLPGMAVDSNGNLYISDSGNGVIRKVTASTGNISTVAGTGVFTYSGDGGPGTKAALNSPEGLAVDAAGNLYIADYSNNRVRKLATNGTITTVAGNGTNLNSGDGGPATSAAITSPWGVTVDGNANLYIATNGNTIRVVSQGTINTIAGTGVAGYAGDGGLATAALLNEPKSVAVFGGNIYVSDANNNAVRVLQPESKPLLTVSSTHSGPFTAGQVGATFTVTVSNAAQAASTSGTVTVTDTFPASLTHISMGGTGWSCTYTSPAYSCQNTGVLAGGISYGELTLLVTVASDAPPEVTNQVTVSGGGSLGTGSADLAFVDLPYPVLESAATHAGNFVLGEPATYTLFVANAPWASATSGAVSVSDTVPSGLNFVSMAGTGWSCTGTTCVNSAVLAGGAGYSPITGVVNVASNASSPVVNHATASGGTSASANSSDTITIVPLSCVVTGGTSASVIDVQSIINEGLGTLPSQHDLNRDGVVNVVDIQIVMNAVLTQTCTL